MSNDPIGPAAEGVPAAKPQDPRLALSFFRRATAEEVRNGAHGFIAWSVEPSGDFAADLKRGKSIAEEALSFMVANPRNINSVLVSDMLSDLVRFGDKSHRGLAVGFGRIIGGLALVGATITSPTALSSNDDV